MLKRLNPDRAVCAFALCCAPMVVIPSCSDADARLTAKPAHTLSVQAELPKVGSVVLNGGAR